MQAVARERVENYVLPIALEEAKVIALEDQDKARAIARNRIRDYCL
jgi:hypothetical protein